MRALTLAIVAAAAVAPAAHATLVFNKGAVADRPTIWAANDDGTNPRKIAGGGLGPRISPDGQTVAYQSVYGDAGTRPQLLTVPVGGGKPSVVLDPQWDPGTQA